MTLPPVVYAGFWLRFWAYLFDLAVIAAITGGFLRSIFRILNIPTGSSIISLYGAFSLLLFLSYFFFMTRFTNGQTLGKMIMGVRVIALDDSESKKLSWKTLLFRECIGRYILQAIPLGVLYLVTPFTPKKQGLADIFADTIVVKDEVYQLFQRNQV